MVKVDNIIENSQQNPVRILIWSIKGGVGKSTIALNIHYLLNIGIITNEEYTLLSSSIKDDKKLLILNSEGEVPAIDKKFSIIFDFAGGVHRDNRVIDALNQSDFVVIPTTTRKADIKGAIATIREIEERAKRKRILIIVNQYKNKEELKQVVEFFQNMQNNSKLENYKILGLKYSKSLEKIYDKKKSIKAMRIDSPLLNFAYKEVDKDFDKILSYINSNN